MRIRMVGAVVLAVAGLSSVSAQAEDTASATQDAATTVQGESEPAALPSPEPSPDAATQQLETAPADSATPADAATPSDEASPAVAEQAGDKGAAAAPPKPFADLADATGRPCELHIWPTDNYIAVSTGLLSGFGALGALADLAAHKNKVVTVKDLMREYLGPDEQLRQLDKADVLSLLKLGPKYRVVIEAPTPSGEEIKKDEKLKAEVKEMNGKLKAGERLSDSNNPCYAELVGQYLFYQKATFYGTRMFGSWVFRRADGDKMDILGKGQVANKVKDFPPKTPDDLPAARAGLQEAYALDIAEWVNKKVKQ